MLARGEAAGPDLVLQHQCTFLADVDIVEIAAQARDALGDLAPVVFLEPERRIAADLFERLVLRRHVPLEPEAIAADGRDPFEHTLGMFFGIVVFEHVEHVIHIDDRLAHSRDQQFGEQRDRCPCIGRPIAAIEQCHDLARDLQRVAAQRYQPPPVAPELHRDHVFGFGAGIEIDPAQRADQRFAFAKGARTRLVADEQFRSRFGDMQAALEPFQHAGAVAADMQPQHFARGGGLPLQRLRPGDRPRSALAIEHPPEQQRCFGFGGVGCLAHTRLNAASIKAVEGGMLHPRSPMSSRRPGTARPMR